ncbi:TIGR02234 family membrane protein [Kitasatospora sp. NPDC002227]|uniref:TIGR02234 family membrane protein n=1 Tax=Kitasatospora sp. NPDC002227 TaxID=3154773 RepID=UPI00331C0574
MSETPEKPRKPAARRGLAVMLGLTAVGVLLVLSSVGRTWAEGKAGQLELGVTGSAISGVPGGLALVALAAAVAVFAVRGAGRAAVGALTLLAGLGAAAAAAAGAFDSSALDAEAGRKLALAGAQAEQISHSAWPWAAALGGLLLAAAGLVTLRSGAAWPAMGARYDAPARKAEAPTARPSSPAELWQALDRGEDPTG